MTDEMDLQTPSDSVIEERHATLYLADGDIVISAPKKSKNASSLVLFRLETLSLRYHSSIFKDMLSLSSGDASTNEQYDGVPRVRLTDDADDLAGLLMAMNNPASLPLKRSHPDTVVEVMGIMRLAVKYDVQAVRNIIVHHVESDWTCTLIQWQQRRVLGANLGQYLGRRPNKSYILACDLPEPASAVRFAVDFDVPKVLPLALYELAFTPHSHKWKAWTGHRYYGDALETRQWAITERYARWELLESRELHAIMSGKEQFTSCWRRLLAGFPHCFPSTRCSLNWRERCRKGVHNGVRAFMSSKLPEENDEWQCDFGVSWKEHVPDDPLTLVQALSEDVDTWELCDSCQEECQSVLQAWADWAWDNLFHTFSLRDY